MSFAEAKPICFGCRASAESAKRVLPEMAMSMEKARSARFMQSVAYWVMDEMRDCGEFTCFSFRVSMQGSRGQTRVALFSVTDKQFVDKPTGLDFVEIGKIRSVERFQGEFL